MTINHPSGHEPLNRILKLTQSRNHNARLLETKYQTLSQQKMKIAYGIVPCFDGR